MLKRKIKTDAEFKNIYNEYIQMLEQLKPRIWRFLAKKQLFFSIETKSQKKKNLQNEQ